MMEPIKPCETYRAVLSSRDIYRGSDGKTVFKVYFVDIVGRSDPARTVWAECGREKRDFVASLAEAEGVEGIGFITAFPHISKAFRFSPGAETVLDVRAWNTADMSVHDLRRGEGYVQFACLAEAVVANDEFAFWAEAETVEEYLRKWSDFEECVVGRHDKLLGYWL